MVTDNSESDADSVDQIAAKPTPVAKVDEGADESDDDDEVEGDEFVVEKVMEHKIKKNGEVLYKIKWEGYPEESDMTWEPIGNLSNATAVVEAYHAKIGGAPSADSKASGKKRGKRTASESASTPAKASKRSRASEADETKTNGGGHKLPSGSWESDVKRVSAIVQEEGDGKEGAKLLGLLEWNTGAKTQHSMEIVRIKLPQKLIDYFVGHLVFQSADPDS